MPMALLSFTLRLACSGHDLREAAAVRAQAYGRHDPCLGAGMQAPDALDHAEATTVLLARDKASGRAVGTARIQCSHPAPLAIEASVALPEALTQAPRAEITRLAVSPGADPLVRLALMKGCWLHAVATQTRHLVIGARSAALIRIYRGLGFEDVFDPATLLPLAHAGGLLHRVLSFEVSGAERRWHQAAHPLHPFMVQTWHPDLQLLPGLPQPAERAVQEARLAA